MGVMFSCVRSVVFFVIPLFRVKLVWFSNKVFRDWLCCSMGAIFPISVLCCVCLGWGGIITFIADTVAFSALTFSGKIL